jgi:hypothetical protein
MNYESEARRRVIVRCFHYSNRPGFALESPKVAEGLVPYAEKCRNLL